MKISAKTEYACLAVLELSIHFGTGEPVRIRQIADTHGVPARFLVQILLQLKSAGLVSSTRGAAGGYQLLKPPADITLGEVMAIVEGEAPVTSNVDAETPTVRVLLGAWRKADRAAREVLRSVTFEKLAERAGGNRAEPMYYI